MDSPDQSDYKFPYWAENTPRFSFFFVLMQTCCYAKCQIRIWRWIFVFRTKAMLNTGGDSTLWKHTPIYFKNHAYHHEGFSWKSAWDDCIQSLNDSKGSTGMQFHEQNDQARTAKWHLHSWNGEAAPLRQINSKHFSQKIPEVRMSITQAHFSKKINSKSIWSNNEF